VQAGAKVAATADEQDAGVDFDADADAEYGSTNSAGTPTSSGSKAASGSAPSAKSTGVRLGPESGAGETALLGARHDLRLADGHTTPVCSCLAAARGAPSSPDFKWAGNVPVIDPSSQTVVALASEGVACSSASAHGASYMGYHVDGNDVVIDIEEAQPGRPITHGAVVPLPQSGGRIVLRGVGKVPYAQSLSGAGACTL
jgi:hypothetical protein